jgi:hypothetical protein
MRTHKQPHCHGQHHAHAMGGVSEKPRKRKGGAETVVELCPLQIKGLQAQSGSTPRVARPLRNSCKFMLTCHACCHRVCEHREAQVPTRIRRKPEQGGGHTGGSNSVAAQLPISHIITSVPNCASCDTSGLPSIHTRNSQRTRPYEQNG